MLKLYKLGDMTRYWEAWNTDTEVTIHWGIVGETGETRDIPLRSGENPNSIIEREAKQPKKEGYRKIPPSKSFRLVIQFRVDGMGSTIDLEKRIRVENLMSECLGWRGLGHCDSGDLGGGTMNIFCFVVDATKAMRRVVHELKANRLDDGAVLAVGSEPTVVWPEDCKGEFSL
jgi:predicted DNA-binding WGR domain protein